MTRIPSTLLLIVYSCILYGRVDGFSPFRAPFQVERTSSLQLLAEDARKDQNGAENAVNPTIDASHSLLPRDTLNNNVVAPTNDNSTSSKLTDFARDLRHLSILRPANPNADFSAPLEIVSAGSSYTRIWTPDTWKSHTVSYPHERYFRHLRRWGYSTTAQKVFPSSILCAGWAFFVSVLVKALPGSILVKVSKGASAALGPLSAPIALLLTLRTNAALGRLNEARLAWGRLILYTRTYTALLRIYVLPYYPDAAILSARHVSIYGWLLKSNVRGEDRSKQLEVMQAVLGKDTADFEWLASQPRPCWAIALRLRQVLAAVTAKYPGNMLVAHNLMEEAIANLEGVTGVCERILASPIPPTYSRHLSRVLSIWLAMLPFGLIGSGIPVLGVALSTAFISYVLVGLDELTMEIENCFALLPLQQLAGAVQSSVGMQLLGHECCEGTVPQTIKDAMPNVSL